METQAPTGQVTNSLVLFTHGFRNNLPRKPSIIADAKLLPCDNAVMFDRAHTLAFVGSTIRSRIVGLPRLVYSQCSKANGGEVSRRRL